SFAPRPISRLTEASVSCGASSARACAARPTRTLPSAAWCTTDGTSGSLPITWGDASATWATRLFVVPRSIPTTRGLHASLTFDSPGSAICINIALSRFPGAGSAVVERGVAFFQVAVDVAQDDQPVLDRREVLRREQRRQCALRLGPARLHRAL